MNIIPLLLGNKKIAILLFAFLLGFPPVLYVFQYFNVDSRESTSTINQTTMIQQKDPSPTVYTESGTPMDPQQILLDYVQNRRPLSDVDLRAKQRALEKLPKGMLSGTLYQSSTITIEYTKSADLFQVELFTKDTDRAKMEAISWFEQKGFSQEGICNLPVSFYMNYQINDQNIDLNPLAPGC